MAATRQLSRVPLDPQMVTRLHACGLKTAGSLFSHTEMDLQELLDLPLEAVRGLLAAVAAHIAPPPVTALQVLRSRAERASHLTTWLPPLDAAMHGGLPAGTVTELVGPAGLGKTQFCLMATLASLAASAGESGTVVFADTERKFSGQRLLQIARERVPGAYDSPQAADALLQRVIVWQPPSSEALLRSLQEAEVTFIDHRVRLLVVDSVASLARAEYGGGGASGGLQDRQRMLSAAAARLKLLAEEFRLPVLVTNQVTTAIAAQDGPRQQQGQPGGGGAGGGGPSQASQQQGQAQAQGGGLVAALGTIWAHAVNTRIVLETLDGVRYLRLAKSPAAPQVAIPYVVTAAGLAVLEGAPPHPGASGEGASAPIGHQLAYHAS